MMELWFPGGVEEVEFRGELITITVPAVTDLVILKLPFT